MKVSASIDLVWQLAAQEAIAAQFEKIEPEHFLASILKFSELPVEEVRNVASGGEAAQELAEEVKAIREEMECCSVDTTRIRREMRGRLGRGKHVYDGGTMHRSQASRDLFDAAARLADDIGGETLMAIHILEVILASPTPLMAQMLGKAAGPNAARKSKTPLLDEHGRDLTRMAADGRLEPVSGRQAECRALIRVLVEKDRKSAMLVSNNDDVAQSVISATAYAIASQNVPPKLKGMRIIDLTNMSSSAKPALVELHNKLFAEVATVNKVILCLPAIESSDQSASERLEQIKTTLTDGSVQCVFRVSRLVFEGLIRKDSSWRRLTQVMWINEKSRGDIPSKL